MSSLFSDEELLSLDQNSLFAENTSVIVLGKTFTNDEERREYFREELRKKLPELKKLEGYPIGEDDDIENVFIPMFPTVAESLI